MRRRVLPVTLGFCSGVFATTAMVDAIVGNQCGIPAILACSAALMAITWPD